jgi:uncharacterized damage-inducible protein DinB
MSPAEAKSLAAIFIQGLEHEAQTTRKVVAALPENQLDFKLGEKGRSARELAWHLVAVDIWFAEGIAKGEFPMEEPAPPADLTVAGMVELYEKNLPAALDKVKALSGEDLAKTVSFFGVYNLPNVFYLQFMSNHSIHHRGQLSTYLRAMNAHVPSIYGGSADEPFEMPASAG